MIDKPAAHPDRHFQLFSCSKPSRKMPFMFEKLDVYQKAVDSGEVGP